MPTNHSSSKHPHSWRQALTVYARPAVLTMLFLGFSAGLPFLLVFSTLNAWLRDVGVDIAAIGFFSWIGMTYSIKFLWAPVVDRLSLPIIGRLFGQRRSWILLGQALIVGGLVILAHIDPTVALTPVVVAALMVAFGSATQDIAIDAYRIESAADEVQAAMASVYIMGYRIALLVAGAGALYIADFFDWRAAYLSMAALMAIGVLTVLLRPEPQRRVSAQTFEQEERVQKYLLASSHLPDWWQRAGAWFVGAVVCPFVDFFIRNGRSALMLLLLVGLYKVSDLAMAAMANPLYIDLGFQLSEIATIGKLFGFAMTIVGGLAGGILVVRYGIGPVLVLGATLIAATNLLFALLAEVGHSIPMLMVTISGDNFSNGLASAVFIAFLSAMTSRQYTATQYALFSSLMTLPGKFLGGFSGVVVEGLGYTEFFVIAALLGLPAIALALWVARSGAGIPIHHAESGDKVTAKN